MWYCFNSGVVTIPALTEINLSNDSGVNAQRLYSVHPITLNRLTTDVQDTLGVLPVTFRENIFINWRENGSGDWTFNVDVPIDFIAGTPQFPYYLNKSINLQEQYLDFRIINRNPSPVNVCIAFFGELLSKSNIIMNPDTKTKRPYNYQILDSSTATITILNGVVTLPAAIPPNAFTGTISVINSYEDYFEITNLWEWLTINLDERITFRVDNSSIPLMNNPVLARNVFGQANQQFEMVKPIWLKRNERLYIDIIHNQPAPIAPFPVAFNFNGNLYKEVGSSPTDLIKVAQSLKTDTVFRPKTNNILRGNR
jgi:hypothetical protein